MCESHSNAYHCAQVKRLEEQNCKLKQALTNDLLLEINEKFGMFKSQDLLERIAGSGADTAYQARWALTARKLLET